MKQPFILFPFLLVFYEFFVNLSNDMYLPALPEMTRDFHISSGASELSITFWLAGNALSQLILGPLSDRYGRRSALFGSGFIFLMATYVCAASDNFSYFLLGRFFEGVGVCGVMVAGYAAIHELYSDEQAIKILGWMGCVGIIAPMAGPLLGAVMLNWGSWRMIFYVLFFLTGLAYSVLFPIMPESNVEKTKDTLNLKSLISTYGKLLRNRLFISSSLSYGLLYSGLILWIAASPFFLMDLYKFSPTTYAFMQIPIFVAFFIGTRIMDGLMSRVPVEKIIAFGLFVAMLSAAILLGLILTMPSISAFYLLGSMSGYAFGFGLAAAALNRITLNATKEKKGAATAIFYLSMIGTGTLMTLLFSLMGEGAVAIFAIFIAVIAAASYLLNRQRNRWALALQA